MEKVCVTVCEYTPFRFSPDSVLFYCFDCKSRTRALFLLALNEPRKIYQEKRDEKGCEKITEKEVEKKTLPRKMLRKELPRKQLRKKIPRKLTKK